MSTLSFHQDIFRNTNKKLMHQYTLPALALILIVQQFVLIYCFLFPSLTFLSLFFLLSYYLTPCSPPLYSIISFLCDGIVKKFYICMNYFNLSIIDLVIFTPLTNSINLLFRSESMRIYIRFEVYVNSQRVSFVKLLGLLSSFVTIYLWIKS